MYIPSVIGSRFVHNKSTTSDCSASGNTANADATMYGRVSRRSYSRNGARHPNTFSMDSPRTEMRGRLTYTKI